MNIPANILYKEGHSQLVSCVNSLLKEIPLYQVEAMLKDVLHEVHEATETEYRKTCEEFASMNKQSENNNSPKGEE